jgi:hypothetical protein
MNSSPLTFNYHAQALSVLAPSPLYFWFICSVTIVSLCFAAAYYRSVSSGGCSLSLSNIDLGPVMIGIVVAYGIKILGGFVPIMLMYFQPGVESTLWGLLLCCLAIAPRLLAFGVAGAAVWLMARRNKFGHVIATVLPIVAMDLCMFIATFARFFAFGHYTLQIVLFFARELLVPAMCIIGARLAQKKTADKVSTP